MVPTLDKPHRRLLFLPAVFCALLFFSATLSAQEKNYATIRSAESLNEIVRKAARVVPSPRQLAWQQLEFISFVHFGMNTFMDQE